ncbi:MAG: copper amine oxidase N-terminal domain-containing protein, partial [Anaerotignum sp.]|nr:copper amine oxidase N-terminal domain-containing protein [Anaerotignum sp.]
MKRMISIITAALMAVGMTTTAFAAELSVTVDGRYVAWTDAKPFIDENDRTLVPLRPIANALGLEVSWDDDKNMASFTDGETTVEFVVGSDEYHAFLNGLDFHMYMEM